MNKKFVIIGFAIVVAVLIFSFVRSRSKLPVTISNNTTNQSSSPAVTALTAQIKAASQTDYDLDGLTDEEEAKLGTDPKVADTDGDGITDGVEVKMFKTNPLKKDSFNLGMTDSEAVIKGLIKPNKGLQLK